MLSIRARQTRLKALGLYTGTVDGIEGTKTKAAYKTLQDKHFLRKSDRDGLYGKNTDILLQCAYNVLKYAPNFALEEFRCQCGGKHCTGYPAVLNIQMLKNVQSTRRQFGPTTITSGLRCAKHNASQGGASASRHMSGKAVDIKNTTSKTESGRKKIMAHWKTLKNSRYTYCNIGGSHPNMATSVHMDVK